MANTIILYPIADVSLEHSLSNTSAAGGYALINDVTSDDTEGYILQSFSRTTQSATSEFSCSATTGKIYITGISTLVRASCYNSSTTMALKTSITPSVSINGGAYSSGSAHSMSGTTTSNSWTNLTDTITNVDGFNTIYESAEAANIVLKIYQNSTTSGEQGKYATGEAGITQANITLTYLDVFDCVASYKAGTGISSVSCSAAEVVDGNTCVFSAILESGATFDGWYSDEDCTILVSTNQTYTATISSNTTLYAKGSILYTISVYADDNCTVQSSASQATGGSSVTITATPNSSRYSIVGWYSNPERTTLITENNPYTFTVTGNSVFYAKSKLNQIIYVKLNGLWVACSKAYKKIDGEWVEQADMSNLFDNTKKYKINQV